MVPFVVSRDQIPAAIGLDNAAKVRAFADHELIARTSGPGTQLLWFEVPSGESLPPRTHAFPSLLIVMRGQATLTGQAKRTVEQGDTVTVPAGESYGFTAVRSELHVLHVRLVAGPDEVKSAQGELTIERLLQHNEARARAALDTPFFAKLRTGALDTPHKRGLAREAIRVFSDAFQTFLFTRQAMCRDASYHAVFHEHLAEEFGHNKMLGVSGNERIAKDPIWQATSAWFSHQMLALDNSGKAVVNLAVETCGFHFHTLAKPVFSSDESAEYFSLHSEADDEHMELGVDLLAGQHPDTYARLLALLDRSWDMMLAVTTRFAELLDEELALS
jgi:quercetin dioxygenase-like cupin family protein